MLKHRPKKLLIEIVNSVYDLVLFLRHAFVPHSKLGDVQLTALVIKLYHTVEKGLALPHPRPGFGRRNITPLIQLLQEHKSRLEINGVYEAAVSSLKEYVKYHEGLGFRDDLVSAVALFVANLADNRKGGTDLIPSPPPELTFEKFFKSRRSWRNFSNKDVSDDLILKALEIARFTPSVCNRQGWHVHTYRGEILRDLLYLQSGNLGFSKEIPVLAIITGEIGSFSYKERNQIQIDSGMFSMSLILALHSLGLVTCPLNLCVSFRIENKIKKLAEIPVNRKLIMYLAIGHPPESHSVAKSYRKPVETFLTANK